MMTVKEINKLIRGAKKRGKNVYVTMGVKPGKRPIRVRIVAARTRNGNLVAKAAVGVWFVVTSHDVITEEGGMLII